jgi:hypothetical protein
MSSPCSNVAGEECGLFRVFCLPDLCKLEYIFTTSIEIYHLQTKFAVPSFNRRVPDRMGALAILATDLKVLGHGADGFQPLCVAMPVSTPIRNKTCTCKKSLTCT